MKTEDIVKKLAKAFSDRQLFLVGGYLRDRLLGKEVSDLDLATDVRPDEIRERVASCAGSIWTIGEKFGTVGFSVGDTKAEITTFRADTYDGVSRKPEVEFGDSIEDDLIRRDFTINAMAHNVHTDELLDPYGGRDDLKAKLVRFVGDAEQRIQEDPLRMLRAIRFCSQLGFELDPVATTAIGTRAVELERISRERIRDELDAILMSSRPSEGIRLAIDAGLARYFMPELFRLLLPEPARYHIKDLLEHTLDTVRLVPQKKALRYAALLHDVAKPETFKGDESGVSFHRHEQIGAERATEILTRLRQPTYFIDYVAKLIRHHLRIPNYRSEWTDSAVRRLMYDLGEQLDEAMELAEADVRASDPVDLPDFLRRMQELRTRMAQIGEASEIARLKPLLNGEEVMDLLGIEPGPQIKEVLDFLLDEQIEGRIQTREAAKTVVRARFKPRE